MAKTPQDPAFAAVNPSVPGLYVWRVENKRAADGSPQFGLATWTDPGQFTNGDSFLVLSQTKATPSSQIARDLFTWAGEKTTSDEFGVAAVKMTELGEFVGAAVHHRELQGYESPLFHAAFAKVGGLRFATGDYPSGWNPMDNSAGVKLFKVKGVKKPVLLEVPPTGASLNQGDAFLLVVDRAGTKEDALYLWIGKGANLKEKLKASQLLEVYRGRLRGAKAVRLEGGETTPEFWAALGGETAIAEGRPSTDEVVEAKLAKKLYKKEGAGWAVVAEGDAVKPALLTGSSNVFVLVRGHAIVLWLGKAAPADVKKSPFDAATAFIKAQGLPERTSITTAKEGVLSEALELFFL